MQISALRPVCSKWDNKQIPRLFLVLIFLNNMSLLLKFIPKKLSPMRRDLKHLILFIHGMNMNKNHERHLYSCKSQSMVALRCPTLCMWLLATLNTLQSSRNPCPTWLPENETQVSIFPTLAFLPWSNRFADTTNHTALKNRDPSKKSDSAVCDDEFVVCCCDANGPTQEVFLLLRVMTSGKDLSS